MLPQTPTMTTDPNPQDPRPEDLTDEQIGEHVIEQVDGGPEDAPAADAAAAETDGDDPTAEAERARTELRELKDKYLRLMAEFDNFRKRTARERLQERGAAAESTIRSLLPVVDDFDRAKATVDDPANDEAFTRGVELVYGKLKRTMESLGAKEMTSTGEAFDPDLMEAFTEIPAPSPDLVGKVVDTIEPGYFLNDKLIRHAKVVVGK